MIIELMINDKWITFYFSLNIRWRINYAWWERRSFRWYMQIVVRRLEHIKSKVLNDEYVVNVVISRTFYLVSEVTAFKRILHVDNKLYERGMKLICIIRRLCNLFRKTLLSGCQLLTSGWLTLFIKT